MSKVDLLLIMMTIAIVIAIGFASIPVAIGVGFGFLFYLLFYSYRKVRSRLNIIENKIQNDYRQTEALFSIFNTLKIQYPLKDFRSWAISPDFAKLIIEIILKNKPQVIVETGSGISTVISAYALKKNGSGKIISLEHLKNFTEKNSEMIKLHQLENYSKIIHAPLKEKTINDEKWLWYDAEINEKIDLLIVDGPPADTQDKARYPALPMFYPTLGDNAIIILDDTIRQEEQAIVERWKKEYPGTRFEYIELEKGAAIITKESN